MENTNIIYKNKKYTDLLEKLEDLEKDRFFCKHDFQHFLDVARLMYIFVLEEDLSFSKDMIYSTAILHDIGRVWEYEKGINHDDASVDIAKELLVETNFSDDEKEKILLAISSHRKKSTDVFASLFYKADKLSRACYRCPAYDQCYWSEEKKNKRIII